MRDPQNILFDVLEAYEHWEAGQLEPTIEVGEEAFPIGRAVGRLWSCRDWMPNRLRANVLDLICHGEKQHTLNTLATYAQAARTLKLRINEAKAA